MEEVREEVVQKTKMVHRFTCDNCGILIDEITECDDGWYPSSKGDYRRSVGLFEVHLQLKRHYCEKCKEIMDDKIKAIANKVKVELEALGFEER